MQQSTNTSNTPSLKPQKRYAITEKGFKEVYDDEIDIEVDDASKLFGSHINLIPLQNNVAGPRLFYGARFYNQALPLKHRESAFVQNLDSTDPEGRSFDEKAGTEFVGAIRSDEDAEIIDVQPNFIKYKGKESGEEKTKQLYNRFQFNRKTNYSNYPKVVKGQQVSKGDLLATSNFTDDNGEIALGVNAKMAIVPYKGHSFEDAFTISENFAKKLTSLHSQKTIQNTKDGVNTDKNHFKSLFPDTYSNEQLDKLDEKGVAKPGAILYKGDPIVLGTKPKTVSASAEKLGNLSKFLKKSRDDVSQVWDHEEPGTVTDVSSIKDGFKVFADYEATAKMGDKLSLNRAGQKGIISKIIKDNEMPKTEKGEQLDVLFNPMGIPSRVNAAAIHELLLGKIAEKTGKKYKIPSFEKRGGKSRVEFIRDELKKHGVSPSEKLYDPVMDRTIENPVGVGTGYVQKLHHVSESKRSERGVEAYDQNEQPLKGGSEEGQSKRISGLEVAGLLSSGAYPVLKDSFTVRGQRNDDYWRMVRKGHNPPIPKKNPFVWDKFQALVTGSGMEVKKLGNTGQHRLGPMTDKSLQRKEPVEIKNPHLLNINNLKPIDGGLMDPVMSFNDKWGKITMDHSYPNPAFENVISNFMDVPTKDLEKIISGEQEYNGLTGPKAIENALKNIDTNQLYKDAVDTVKSNNKSRKPKAIKTLNFLEGLEKNELKPEDLLVKSVPVIPSKFRPVTVAGDTVLTGDVNDLYRDVMQTRDADRKLKEAIGEENALDNQKNVYQSIKALYGYDKTPNPKLKKKEVSGFLKKLIGPSSPKHSFIHEKMLSKPQDFTGRATVTTDPDLSINEIGIPEEMAWSLYKPYIQQKLAQKGFSPVQALKSVTDRDSNAVQALKQNMAERPIMYTRAPAWHKYNSIGGYPKIVGDDSIHANPLVTSGLNLDHDGDAMNIHVPGTEEAVQTIKDKLLPTKMLHSIKDFESTMAPLKQEFISGLSQAQRQPSKQTHTFPDRKTALQAIKLGRVSLSDDIKIMGE